jgi:RNA-directed DNA polymerase
MSPCQETENSVQLLIVTQLWRWARRRHPNKTRQRIKAKYFHTLGPRKWLFCGEIKDNDQQVRKVRLSEAAKVPIKRHIKI